MTLSFDQTLGLSHPFSVGKNVHSILANPNPSGTFYADIAARDADTDFQVLENVGKAVGITSPLSIFVLMSTGPAVWVELGTGDPIDTFLELTDVLETTYTGFALNAVRVNAAETGLEFTTDDAGNVINVGASTDNALARFDGITGKLIQNSLGTLDDSGILDGLTQVRVGNLILIGSTIVENTGSVFIESGTSSDPLIMKGPGIGNPVLFNVLSGVVTAGKFGDLGSTGLNLTADFGQIGWNNFADLELAPQANAASDIAFFTPNAGLTSLIERMRIKTSTGEVLTGNLSLLGNTLATTDTNGNLLLAPNGIGLVDVTTRRIINVVDPTADQDAATRKFVLDNAGLGDVVGPGSSLDNSIPSFDGTTGKILKDPAKIFVESGNVGIGIASGMDSLLHVFDGSAGTVAAFGSTLTIENSGDCGFSLLCPDANVHQILFGNPTSPVHGGIFYSIAAGYQFRNNVNQNRMCIEQDGSVGIGTTSPDSRLHVLIGASGSADAPAGTTLTLENNGSNFITMQQPDISGGGILFQYPTGGVRGAFSYSTNDDWAWSTVSNALKMTLTSAGVLSILNGVTAGTGQLTIGTSTAVSGASITLENATALMCGQLTGGSGKWQIKTTGGVVRIGSVQPTATGIMTNDVVRTQWDLTDGRIRNLFGITTKKTNVADADYTIISTDYRIAITSITASRTITIPTAEIAKGSPTEAREWKFKDQSGSVSGSNKVTIATEGSENIDGAPELVLNTPFFDFTLYADGSNVYVEAA